MTGRRRGCEGLEIIRSPARERETDPPIRAARRLVFSITY
jgi:hypothetical protein